MDLKTKWRPASSGTVVPPRLKAGIGSADITPALGMKTSCCPDVEVAKIESPLLVKVCLFQSAGQRYAIVTADVCSIFQDTIADVRKVVSKVTLASPENIFVTASHTHSAPYPHIAAQNFLTPFDITFLDQEYYDRFLESVRVAATGALSKLAGIRLKYSEGSVEGLASNRRLRMPDGTIKMRWGRNDPQNLKDYPDGVIDPLARCLWLEGEGGDLLGGLVNYACHPTTFSQYEQICWDYPGFARQEIEKALQCQILFMQGCSGNIGPGKYTGSDPLADTIKLGGIVAKAVIAGYPTATVLPSGECAVFQAQLNVEKRISDTESGLQAAIELALADYIAYRAEHPDDRRRRFLGSSLLSLVERLLIGKQHHGRFVPVEISLLKLGDATLVFLPSEMFVEASIRIFSEFTALPMLITAYTDNTVQYVPTKAAYDDDSGYEAGEMWCFCGRGSLEVITERTLEMLSQLNESRNA